MIPSVLNPTVTTPAEASPIRPGNAPAASSAASSAAPSAVNFVDILVVETVTAPSLTATAAALPMPGGSGAMELTPQEQDTDKDSAIDAPWPPDGLASLWLPAATDPTSSTATQPLAAASQVSAALPANPAAAGIDLTAPTPEATLTTSVLPSSAETPCEHQQAQASSPALPTAVSGSTLPASPASTTAITSKPGTLSSDADSPAISLPSDLTPQHEQGFGARESIPPPTPLLSVPSSPLPSNTPAPSSPTTAPFPAPDLHADNFSDTLSSHIHWLAEQKIGHAHLQLHPQEMGQVEVRLKLDGDQLHADFISAQPEVRQALEHGLPRLRDLLSEHGLHLAQTDVGQQPSRQSSASPHTGSTLDSEHHDDAIPAPISRPGLHSSQLLDAYA